MIVEVELDFQAPEIRTAGPTVEYNVRKPSFAAADGYTFAEHEAGILIGHDDSKLMLDIPRSSVRFIKRELPMTPRQKREHEKKAAEAARSPVGLPASHPQSAMRKP